MGTKPLMRVLVAGALVAACGDQTTAPVANLEDTALDP